MWARNVPKSHIALVGESAGDIRDIMVEGPDSGILACAPPWFMPKWEPSKRRLTWPNGSYATTYSADKPRQLRGPQHHFAWVDELAKYQYPTETFDMLAFGLRLGKHPQCIVTTTPKPVSIIKKLVSESRLPGAKTIVRGGSTLENAANLAPSFINKILRDYEGTRLGQQEIYGVLLDDNPNALWSSEGIEKNRIIRVPDLRDIVVAVDPSATATGDDAGIIVVGVADIPSVTGLVPHLYVLEDGTLQGTPIQWASQAVALYNKWRATCIVAESNQGGEMVSAVIRSLPEAGLVPIRLVHASKGKQARAEPVATLYEQGRGHHIGTFGALEAELTQWSRDSGESPNRLDALVWGAYWLIVKPLSDPEDYQATVVYEDRVSISDY